MFEPTVITPSIVYALCFLIVALLASELPGNMASVTNMLFVSCWLVLICFLCLFKEHASKHCCEMLLIIHRASFLTKTVPSGNELHKFLIWDTAGQERVSATTTEIPQWLTVCFKFTHMTEWITFFLKLIFRDILQQEMSGDTIITLSEVLMT